MSKALKTREYIIEKSARIFNTKGYAGTSLADLMEATGLTKGSIYGNFENKDEVAVAVYGYNVGLLGKRLDDAINDKISASDKLIAFTEYYRTNWKWIFEKGGCPMLNASVEADDNLLFMRKNVQRSIKNWLSRIANIIDTGKLNGEFNKNIDTSNYTYIMLSLVEGGIMLAKIENNSKHLFSALDRIIKIVNEEIKK